ncbi:MULTISPECIES: LYR motif-containing protein [Spirosoma]|uniref:Uncharacterized protein n=1 Tax=Spirosoma sordidisoli TaxID=2502893 RepID=A0A4Q2UFU2_9BACT|nr:MULTISPECIES: hypothetical protein [Spirosoma]RYC66231.1 hypothetical protein EQG79_30725 [Spirosoma sordidisoli]
MKQLALLITLGLFVGLTVFGCRTAELMPANTSVAPDVTSVDTPAKVFYKGKQITDPKEIERLLAQARVAVRDSANIMTVYDSEDDAPPTLPREEAVDLSSYVFFVVQANWQPIIGLQHKHQYVVTLTGTNYNYNTKVNAIAFNLTTNKLIGNGFFLTTPGYLARGGDGMGTGVVRIANVTPTAKTISFKLNTGATLKVSLASRATTSISTKIIADQYYFGNIRGYVVSHLVQ